jgi:hypothetical protein
MEYELIFKKKSEGSDSELDNLLHRFNAQSVDPHVWHFSSDKSFQDVVFKVSRSLDSGFRYFIVALDGSEDKHTPGEYWTNDDYIRFCADRLTKKGVAELHTLRRTAQVNFGRS